MDKRTEYFHRVASQRIPTEGRIVVWTHGQCFQGPTGEGGCGAVFEESGVVSEFSGVVFETNNHKAEVESIAMGLERSRLSAKLIIRSSSQVCILTALRVYKWPSCDVLWDRISVLIGAIEQNGGSVDFEWWAKGIGGAHQERAVTLSKGAKSLQGDVF